MVYKPLSILALPSLAFGASFQAFKNSKCSEPMALTAGNQTVPNGELLIDTAITEWNGTSGPAGHWYNKMKFENATTSGTIAGTGASNVYWKVPDADPGCTFALMKQTHGPDQGWKTLTPLPGEIALITQDEGCYYSSLNDFDGVITSYCCGEGDCAGLHMGANLFVSKRDLSSQRAPLSNSAAATRTVRSSTKALRNAAPQPPPENLEGWAPADETSPEKFKDYHIVIHTKRGLWDKVVDWFTPDPPQVSVPPLPSDIPSNPSPTPTPVEPAAPACTIKGEPQKIGTTTGQQRIVTDPQSCDTGPGTCAHTVSVSFQASTALSNSKSSTWTVTGGTNVGITGGLSFLGEAKVDAGLTASVAKAWTEDTGTTITTGWSNSTSQTIVQQVGTHAMLTFTPYYVCWKGDASCGEDENGNEILIEGMDFCQPSLRGDGGEIVGQYAVVYI